MGAAKIPDDFDWIQLSAEINPKIETFPEKIRRKVMANPFVPIGKHLMAGNDIYIEL